jgi:methyl-accepting chemotaxis protein
MTIGKKITFGFVAAVAITALLGAFSFSRLTTIAEGVKGVTDDSLPSVEAIHILDTDTQEQRGEVFVRFAETDPAQLAVTDKRLSEIGANIDKDFQTYQSVINDGEDKQNFEQLKLDWNKWEECRNQMLGLSRTGQDKAASDLYTRTGVGLFLTFDATVDKMSDWNHKDALLNAETANHAVTAGKSGVMIGISAAVLAAAVIGALIILGIKRSLTRVATNLSAGSEQVASAASQVSSASQSLAQGASEQAASLEETSSSLEEISSMTRKNADIAQQASALSSEAKAVADKGNTAMSKMSAAIGDIQKSAVETAKIIKTIDEIAFQTNLLALNAAVEAARAGEAGKGFAVVAEEVRNLAMRSAEAAKNTASLIEGSVQNARNGVSIADEVARTLAEITISNSKVNLLISEIAAASSEQSQGVGQVNQAIQQMDKVTQGNAAAAEECAASAEEMNSQSEQLRSFVGDLSKMVQGSGNAVESNVGPSHARSMSIQNKRSRLSSINHTSPSSMSHIPMKDLQKKEDDFADFNVAA